MANITGSYCAIAGITKWIPHQTFNTSSKPTLIEAKAVATADANIINGILDERGYVTPVTNGTGVSRLRPLNERLTAAHLLQMRVSENPGGPDEHSVWLLDEANRELTRLQKGQLSLGANTARTSDYAVSPRQKKPKGRFDLDSEGDERDPIFSTRMNF